MLLKSFQVTTYQGVLDSGRVDADEITCLVGKNEAGKTAILKALYRLNPIRSEDSKFSVTDDYPRSEVSDYEDRVAQGKGHAQVIQAAYELETHEVSAVEQVFGPSFLRDNGLTLTKYYDNERRFQYFDGRSRRGRLLMPQPLPAHPGRNRRHHECQGPRNLS